MSEEAEIAGRAPLGVDVEEGKTYWWCSCGRSKSQPFCDGSHKATTFVPQRWDAKTSGKVFFCTCKQTDRAPLCDGSHNAL